MPVLKIKNDNSEYNVDKGSSLLEISQELDACIPFGCCAGACGTCRISVIENPENLSKQQPEEEEFLRDFVPDAGPNDRLACQCVIEGDVTVEVVDSGNHNHPK